MNATRLNRRQFLHSSLTATSALVLGTAAAPSASAASAKRTAIDQVTLGQTGIKLSRLGMGTGSNSGQVQEEILRDSGDRLVGALKAITDRTQLIQTAFRSILSRDAQPDEIEPIVAYLAAREDRPVGAIQQVVWALVTDSEFRFNY